MASKASSAVIIPFSQIGTLAILFKYLTSSQVKEASGQYQQGGSYKYGLQYEPSLLAGLFVSPVPTLAWAPPWISSVRSSEPVLTPIDTSKLAIRRCGGTLKPLRISVRRRPKKGVSTVKTIALYPASIQGYRCQRLFFTGEVV